MKRLPKKAADEAAAKKAADEAAAALAAENSNRKADNAVLRPTPTGSDLLEESSVGAKNVVKNRSNLTTNYSSAKDSTSNTPELMNVQSPDNELKTLVVGQVADKTDGKVKVVYLDGLKQLAGESKDGKVDLKEVAVPGDKGKKADTAVYTVEKGRKNYTENYDVNILNVTTGSVEEAKEAIDKARKPDGKTIVGQMYGAKITDGEVLDAITKEKNECAIYRKIL